MKVVNEVIVALVERPLLDAEGGVDLGARRAEGGEG